MLAMMRKRTLTTYFSLTILLAALAFTTGARAQQQQQQKQFQPTVGQDGKDVIWVPTPEEVVAAMLDMAKVTPNDYVIDLGSGDGRIVIAAAKLGARALGVEYNPDMVQLSKDNAQKEGVSGRANFVQADIFATDFSQATVITMYLLPSLNMRLRPQILEMKPGTRVASNSFNMEDWEPDETRDVAGRTAFMWIVPAKVAGTWTWQAAPGNAELTLRQTFQKIEGDLRSSGKGLALKNAKLEGDRITFAAGESQATTEVYTGRVNGNAIEGTMKAGNNPEVKWTAQRRPSK
jgi:SAM-dependent methyltransferase